MSTIFRPPRGLLDLLDIKATGQNPSILPTVVQPTLSLDALYLANLPLLRLYRQWLPGGAGNATSAENIAEVPDGELWNLVSYWSQVTPLGAGDIGRSVVTLVDPVGNRIWASDISPIETNYTTLRAFATTGGFFPENFFLPPGFRVGHSTPSQYIAATGIEVLTVVSYRVIQG